MRRLCPPCGVAANRRTPVPRRWIPDGWSPGLLLGHLGAHGVHVQAPDLLDELVQYGGRERAGLPEDRAAVAEGHQGGDGLAQPAQKADAELASAPTFSREEERMARDLYAALAKKDDDALPFSRITLSEQRHFDAVGTLMTRYGVADPSAGKAAGKYADEDIQKLYAGWLAQGSKSLEDAHQGGIDLEKRDIADLQRELKAVKQSNVKLVLERLLAGSENHLRAFTAAKDGTLGQMGGRQGRRGGQDMGRSGQAGQRGGKGMGMRAGGGQGLSSRRRSGTAIRTPAAAATWTAPMTGL